MRKGLFVCLFILTGVCGVCADGSESAGLITNIDGRKTVSLDGRWPVIIDLMDTGVKKRFYENRKPVDKSDLVEYDFDAPASEKLNVPGDWNTQRQYLWYYEGSVWYKKSFDYQLPRDRRLFVYFGAANYQTDVWLNGQKIGSHEGGFTPFNFEITQQVKPKDNFLIVRVNNQRRLDAIPPAVNSWWNYGGLTRSVVLVELAETFIQDYFIQLKEGSVNEIFGWVKLNGVQSGQRVTIEIPEKGIKHTFVTDKNGFAEFGFNADLELWSPKSPKLYEVKITAETDAVVDLVGFRTIETKGTEILLNGEPVFLRGICIHEEAPIRGGRAYSEQDAKRLLDWVSQLNCNFVRLAHYPYNEHIVRLADKRGLMLWAEVPVFWKIQADNKATLANAKNQLTEIITRDKNRAAVILWSMANETDVGKSRNKFIREIIKHTRRLDPTRLTTAALKAGASRDIITIDDPIAGDLDVIGCNEYIGWYDRPLPDSAETKAWKDTHNKPLIISEFGGGALYGLHGDALTKWTEEYQENLYNHQINMLKKIPFLRGVSPWILVDFREPRRPLAGIQDHWNRKGLMTNSGQKKKAFYVLQKFYEELKSQSVNN